MKNKNRIKDPKKVAAGKARAASSLRVNGRFTTNKFLDKVKSDAIATGVKEKDVFDFFIQNESAYAAIYSAEMITTNRNIEQLKRDFRSYDGNIVKNGRLVKKETALKSISELNRYLRGEHEIVSFHLKPGLSLNGKMYIKLPSVREIMHRVEDGEDIDDIMDEYGITTIRSTEKD